MRVRHKSMAHPFVICNWWKKQRIRIPSSVVLWCFFKNKWQIIRFFQILCVNLHYHLKFNPINLVKLWKKIRIINSSRISSRWASALKLQRVHTQTWHWLLILVQTSFWISHVHFLACLHLRSRVVLSWRLNMLSDCSRHCRAIFITTSSPSVKLSCLMSKNVQSLHSAHQKVRHNVLQHTY